MGALRCVAAWLLCCGLAPLALGGGSLIRRRGGCKVVRRDGCAARSSGERWQDADADGKCRVWKGTCVGSLLGQRGCSVGRGREGRRSAYICQTPIDAVWRCVVLGRE